MPEGERRLSAIMFTDIVGYTGLTQKDEKLALSLLERHRELIRPVVAQHGGREVKTIGDGFLIEFASALDATECAADIQKVLHEYNRGARDKFQVRIGVHVGDVVHNGHDVYGDAVNIASRIEPLAEPGGICISEQVYDQVRNKVRYGLEKLPPHSLKNVDYPVDAYRILLQSEDAGPAAMAPKNRLAVLPLSNISPDAKDAYFADGMTEELITVLSQVQGLRVIARTSVDHYKTRDRRVAQIGTELGVGSLIEGSVRIAGDRLRVTVQLIDASNEEHLWSENYDRRLDDIFEVQSDIARRVAKGLEVKLMAGEEDRLDRRHLANVTVYKNYLKGRALIAKRNRNEMMEAKQLFENAIAEDPKYAQAFAGLAETYFLLGDYMAMPFEEARRKSSEFLSKALKLDPELPEARALLALGLSQEFRFKEAESEFKHAINLNPSYATAHFWYSNCLGSLRRYEEQLEQLEIAEQLDPLSTPILINESAVLALFGKKELAWEKVKRFTELNPGALMTVDWGSMHYYLTGDPQRALSEIKKHPELHHETQIIVSLACFSAAVGDRPAALGWLEKLLALPDNTSYKAVMIANVYLELRDLDQYFAWVNKAVDKKEMDFIDSELYPNIKQIVGDPRWKALMKRVNLDND